MSKITRALISVSDKEEIVKFAYALEKRGIEILSTNGTAKLLNKHGIQVIEVSDYTHFPEIMSGRVKTLHPRIYGGILRRRGTDDIIMQDKNILPIDLVCVSLYPFEKVIKQQPISNLLTAVENIDIGGQTMIRAAAKNYANVTVIISNKDYDRVLNEIDDHNGCVTSKTRFNLAVKAFEYTAQYEDIIANYLGTLVEKNNNFPRTLNIQLRKKKEYAIRRKSSSNCSFLSR